MCRAILRRPSWGALAMYEEEDDEEDDPYRLPAWVYAIIGEVMMRGGWPDEECIPCLARLLGFSVPFMQWFFEGLENAGDEDWPPP
nr:de novo NANOG homeodomain fragment [synthetic construct]